MKKCISYILVITTIAGIIAGCASITPTLPGAEKVVITNSPVAKKCKMLGEVSAIDNARSMNTPYFHTSLKDDEFNRLKNQAFQLGANTVVLSPSSGMINKRQWTAKTQHRIVGTHAYTGAAYWCPAS